MHGLVFVATRHAARNDPRICDAHRDNEKNFAPRRIGVRVFGRSFVVRAFQTTMTGGKCVNPDSGCPCKAGCRYGGDRVGCCVPR